MKRRASSGLLGWTLIGLLPACYSQWDEESKQPPPYRVDPTPVCSLSGPVPGFTCPRSSLPSIGLLPGCCDFADNVCGVDTTVLGSGCLAFGSAEYQSHYPHGNPPVRCDGTALDGWESACRDALRASAQASARDASVAQDGGSRALDGGLRDGGARDGATR